MLYDTFGFPLEITQEVAAERQVDVDLPGFQQAMQLQRSLSQAAAVSVDVTADSLLAGVADSVGETAFLGYGALSATARVVALLVDGKPFSTASPGQTVELVLDSSPFYAESGGQVGDIGTLSSENGSTHVRVTDTQKAGGGRLFIHRGEVYGSGLLEVESIVTATVDSQMRRRVRAQ
jgi:alanyl-tRNA synthetase